MAKISDDNIRIPSTDLLAPSFEELERTRQRPVSTVTSEAKPIVAPASEVDSVPLKDSSQSAFRFYGSLQAGPAAVRELPAVTTYGTNNYTAINLHVGTQFPLRQTNLPPLMQTSGPTIDIGTSLVFGSTENLYSGRHAIGGRAGWQQSLFALNVGEVTFSGVSAVRAGLAWDYNKMNFGGGEIPQPDRALMVGLNGMAGLDICLPNSLCVAAMGGYSYDRSIVGNTRYQTSYPTTELTVSGALPEVKRKGR